MRWTSRWRWIGGLTVIGLSAAVGAPAGGATKGVSLGPPVAQVEAGLAVAVEYGPPEAVQGVDAAGQSMFLGADRAGGFLSVNARALRGNKNGFGAEEFIPYLSVSYRLRPPGGGAGADGVLYPMVGPRGLRYGNNVPALVPGRYRLTLDIEPPIKLGFGRHTDIETGVGRWWRPLKLEWTLDVAQPVKP